MTAERSSGDDGTRELPAPGRRQRQAEATREQLLHAAREQFETRGYQATTVGSITELANTAHGTFYLYFKNKEDAFEQVIADVVKELYDASTGTLTVEPSSDIDTSIRAFLQVFIEHRDLWRSLLEATLQSPTIQSWWLDLRRTFMNGSVGVLRALQEDGQMRQVDPELAAHALGSMIEWFAFVHFVLREPDPGSNGLEAATVVLRDLWEHAVFGVLTE